MSVVLLLALPLVGIVITWLFAKQKFGLVINTLQYKLDEAERKLKEQETFIQNSQSSMSDSFKALASEILKENNKAFLDLAETKLKEKVAETNGVMEKKEQAIDQLVKPLTESLKKMDEKIEGLEKSRVGAYSSLTAALTQMQNATKSLDKGTQSLVSALKNTGTRGKYGEIGLRRVVEFAGMSEHCDFEEQKHLDSDDGKLIPDMTINLPEGKNIVVDSKVPLDAYMKVFETEDETQQKVLMAQHAAAVKGHLRKLSAKNYWSQFKQSPDYVILYMQIESSFAAALQEDPLLIEEGIKNRVIFATPTTLITLLRTVSFVWQQRDITKNIEEIKDAGIELYNRTNLLVNYISKIGNGLDAAVKSYNEAVGSLESRFIPQAKKLYLIGKSYIKTELPNLDGVDQTLRKIEKFDGGPQEDAS
jgi:DNA recombination protein RmuC